MLLRMADWRNLTVMLPCTMASSSLNYPRSFPGRRYPHARHQFDIIASHAVLDAPAMVAYARYHIAPLMFTVLREPLSRLGSALDWYHPSVGSSAVEGLVRRLERTRRLPQGQVGVRAPRNAGVPAAWRRVPPVSHAPLPLALPFTRADAVRFINNQAHDLGWYRFEDNARFTRHDHNDTRVHRWLRELEGTLDLVLVLERLPEGLALLRHRIGAHRVALEEFASVRQKSNRSSLGSAHFTESQQHRVLALNAVDSHLYRHFSRKFEALWASAPQEVHAEAAVIRRMHDALGDGLGECRLMRMLPSSDSTAAQAHRHRRSHGLACPQALLTDVAPYLHHHLHRAQSYCHEGKQQCRDAYGAYLRACAQPQYK